MKKNKWVVLRGLGRGHGHWGTFLKKMEAAFPQDRIYWLDLPGNGFLNKEVSPVKLAEYIPFLEAQLKETDFFQTEGATLGVGLSLGAMVLVAWSQKIQNRFDKIFLINTSAANFSAPWTRISALVLFNSIRQLFTAKLEQFEMNSLLVTTNLSEEKIRSEFHDSFAAVIDFSKKYPIVKDNITRQLLAAARYVFPVTPAVPTVLLRGEKDRFVNPQCTADIQKRWNCRMLSHPSAGHDIAFEDAAWLLNALQNEI